MLQIFSSVFQLIAYLVEHKDEIKTLIKNIQDLIPEAPGGTKAAIIKDTIATALGMEDKIEKVWPLVSGLFNSFVADTKAGK